MFTTYPLILCIPLIPVVGMIDTLRYALRHTKVSQSILKYPEVHVNHVGSVVGAGLLMS